MALLDPVELLLGVVGTLLRGGDLLLLPSSATGGVAIIFPPEYSLDTGLLGVLRFS